MLTTELGHVSDRSALKAAGTLSPAERAVVYQRFSTEGLPAARRVPLWEQHNARALIGLTARTLDGSPLDATEVNLRLRSMQFAYVSASAHVVERSATEISRAPSNSVAMYFTLFGEAYFYNRHGVMTLAPSNLLTCHTNRPFARGFARGLREFVLTVPAETFTRLSCGRDLASPVVHDFSAATGNAAARRLCRLIHDVLRSPAEHDLARVDSSAMELIRTLFAPDHIPSADVHRNAAREYVERNFGDPGLSVAKVAAAVGISERHLSRLFRENGEGVARLITETRLSRARRLLVREPHLPIGAVAVKCGFSSHAAFSRAFREHLGMTPGEARTGGNAESVINDREVRPEGRQHSAPVAAR